MMCVYSIMCSV